MRNPQPKEGAREIRTWNIRDEDLVFEDGSFIPLSDIDDVTCEEPSGIGGASSAANLIKSGWFGLAFAFVGSYFVRGSWSNYIAVAAILLLITGWIKKLFYGGSGDDPLDLVTITAPKHPPGQLYYHHTHDLDASPGDSPANNQANRLAKAVKQAKTDAAYRQRKSEAA